MIEGMDYFQGFQFHFALHGGTGSGLGLHILQRLAANHQKAARHCSVLMPSIDYKTSTIEPYNAIFALEQLEYATLVTLLDNQSLYDYFEHNCSIAQPNYNNLNELISKTQISINNPLMYPCAGKRVFMRDYEGSLVPYGAVKYCYPSFYDLNTLRAYEESKETEMTYLEEKETQSVVTATQYCSSLPFKMFATTHPSFRQLPVKLIGLQANFSGKATNPFEMIKGLQILKSRPQYQKFLNYIPSGIKGVLVNETPQKSIAMLNHSTNIGSIIFTTILEPYRKLYSKRAFTFWYLGEGPDSGIFGSADNACAGILQNYTQIEQQTQSDGEYDGQQQIE